MCPAAKPAQINGAFGLLASIGPAKPRPCVSASGGSVSLACHDLSSFVTVHQAESPCRIENG
jgi:hypothetical protein